MPNRILREGINSSARVNALSPMAELFYRRLFSVVDDYGRYYAAPQTLIGACWPTTPERVCAQDVSRWLAECAQPACNLISVYVVNGAEYLQLVDFKQHIRSKSKFPEPASELRADCAQNARTSRSSYFDVRSSESNDAREARTSTPIDDEPPDIRSIAHTKRMPGPARSKYDLPKLTAASEALQKYPGLTLKTIPDEAVCAACLDVVSGDVEWLWTELRNLALQRQKPASSWMWFPTVLKSRVAN